MSLLRLTMRPFLVRPRREACVHALNFILRLYAHLRAVRDRK